MPKTSSPNSREQTEIVGAADVLAGKRVVVCEDEGLVLIQLKRALTRAGLVLAGIADNGADAIETVLRERPDIVMMDIRMPVLDGLQAAERILQAMPVCVVMLTAFSDEEYQQRARSIGASGYIIKPISRETLLPQVLAAYRKFKPDE